MESLKIYENKMFYLYLYNIKELSNSYYIG